MIPEGVIPVTILVFLAVIGAMTLIAFSVRFWKSSIQSLRNFNALITETRDFLKEHSQDLRAAGQLREIFATAQDPSSPNFGPPSADAANPPAQRVEMPKPMWEWFNKAPEPDAPSENVDMTASENEVVDEDRADQLERMGLGRPDPEFKPKAVEVESD